MVYKTGDKSTLKTIAEEVLSELLRLLEEKGETEIVQKLYSKVIYDPDVFAFYKESEVLIPFNKISVATQADYDDFRKEACVSLLQ